jgi:CRP-like cAMP-binding protein
MNETYAKLMTSFSLFQGYTEYGAQELLALGEVKNLEKGQIVFLEGDQPNAVYLVLTGSLEAYLERQGQVIRLHQMPPGTLLGELGVLCDDPRSASVRGVENATVVRWENKAFQRMLMRDFDLVVRIFAKAVQLLKDHEKSLMADIVKAQTAK